jgi:hypothetical protein
MCVDGEKSGNPFGAWEGKRKARHNEFVFFFGCARDAIFIFVGP